MWWVATYILTLFSICDNSLYPKEVSSYSYRLNVAMENPGSQLYGSSGNCLECKFIGVKVIAVWVFNSQVECIVLCVSG